MSNSCFILLQTTVNLELCKINHLLRVNKFSFNCNKTNFVLLNSKNTILLLTTSYAVNFMHKRSNLSYLELVEVVQFKIIQHNMY